MKVRYAALVAVSSVFLVGCAVGGAQATPSHPSTQVSTTGTQEQPDDIVSTPGGPAYRADVHEEGVQDNWPPVKTVTLSLGEGSGTLRLTYRDQIQTIAGQVRNNLFAFYLPNVDPSTAPKMDARLAISDLPAGITVSESGQYFGADPGRQSWISLRIDISSQIVSSSYSFNIDVTVNDQDYGSIPCKISL